MPKPKVQDSLMPRVLGLLPMPNLSVKGSPMLQVVGSPLISSFLVYFSYLQQKWVIMAFCRTPDMANIEAAGCGLARAAGCGFATDAEAPG